MQTQITLKGLSAGPNMHNRKPFRSQALKKMARENASKRSDGAYRSTTPTLTHDAPKKGQS